MGLRGLGRFRLTENRRIGTMARQTEPKGRTRSETWRTRSVLGMALIAALAACPFAVETAAANPVEHYNIEIGDYYFDPSTIAAQVGSEINMTLRNLAAQLHEFEIVGYDIEVEIPPGETRWIEFAANKAGSFEILCAMPGHAEAGMVGRFVVIGNADPAVLQDRLGDIDMLLEMAVEEYQAGVAGAGGQVLDQGEYLEARAFLNRTESALDELEEGLAATVPAAAADVGELRTILDTMEERMTVLAPPAEVEAVAETGHGKISDIVAAFRTSGASSPASGGTAEIALGLVAGVILGIVLSIPAVLLYKGRLLRHATADEEAASRRREGST